MMERMWLTTMVLLKCITSRDNGKFEVENGGVLMSYTTDRVTYSGPEYLRRCLVA